MKKRLPALLLTLTLALSFLPAAVAAQFTYFPEFAAETGCGMEPDKAWPAPDTSMVPSQTYFGSISLDDCLDSVRSYVAALEGTGEFEVVYPLQVVRGKAGGDDVGYSCNLRYTGSAGMNGTLKATRAGMTWGDYGEYHIAIGVEYDASRPNAARRTSVTLRWDAALRPEGIDFYAGSDEGTTGPDTGSQKPDTGTTKPDTGSTGSGGSGSVGNADNTFQDLDSAMGYYLSCSDGGLYYEDTSKDPVSYETLLQFAQEYVDLLTGQDNFYLASRRKNGQLVTREDTSWSGGRCSAWYIRYAGTAPMEENLAAGGAIDWNNYGPFHLKVMVWDSGKSTYITMAWDDGLRPVESDRRTPSGAKLGSAQRPAEAVTVVLAIGYNQMAVNGDVFQVDGDNAAVCPVAANGRTLVPVSRIVDAFGGESTWDSATNNTTYTLDNRKVEHVIGSQDVIIQKGGQRQKKTMEVPSVAMNNRTYVPVRYVLEGLGLWVGYEPTYQLVVVSTQDLSGEDLIKLPQTQRLFDSEPVPETPRKIVERYTIDGENYIMEVGEALTLYNSRTAISGFSAYSWDVLEGGELVKVDRNQATCKFYAKRPGVVVIQSHMDETVVNYVGPSTHNEVTYTMTITIVPATAEGSQGGLMQYLPCRTCNGTGKIQVGSRQETCPTCLGDKFTLQ